MTVKKNVQDVYPLSPMQAGLLFHSLYTPTANLYAERFVCTFEGALQPAAFEQAWQRLVDRHSVLRTAFVWQNIQQPIQMVGRQVKVRLQYHDWRGATAAEH